MKTVKTFTATIYVGFKNRSTGSVHPIETAMSVIQGYVDDVGLCVTVTPTTYVYTEGNEPGIAVGLINYPRFPSTPKQIRTHAITLAERLRVRLQQYKVCVVMPRETVMLGEEPKAVKKKRGAL